MGERLGFIGLGKMGTPLTRSLIADGPEVAGWKEDDCARVVEVYEGKDR